MKKTKTPSIVTISTLTLITILFWVFFSVYRVFTIKPPDEVPEEILSPIDPALDSNALSNLTKRKYMDESLIPDVSVGNIPTPQLIISTPSPTQSPIPLPNESSTPTPSPSGGANPTT